MSNLILSILKKERPWANRSRQSLQNRDREQIALVDPYKRATVSESIVSIFTKERCQWLACDSSESLSKNAWFACFPYIFDSFPHLLCQKSKLLPSLFALFLNINGINSLSSIFNKEQLWERIDPVDLKKRATVSESIPSIFKKEWLRANQSCRSLKRVTGAIHFIHDGINLLHFWSQKTSCFSKNRWLNSQPSN